MLIGSGVILSSSDSPGIVAGVAAAGSPAGVVGGVVPVCGIAKVVVWSAGCGAVRGDGFVVEAVLSEESVLGVGGIMGINVLLCGVVGAGAQMCVDEPSMDADGTTVGLETGVGGAGAGGVEFLLM